MWDDLDRSCRLAEAGCEVPVYSAAAVRNQDVDRLSEQGSIALPLPVGPWW